MLSPGKRDPQHQNATNRTIDLPIVRPREFATPGKLK
jgi:hypothetical protein